MCRVLVLHVFVSLSGVKLNCLCGRRELSGGQSFTLSAHNS